MSTTFYDTRAERKVASALADERRAAAEATRAETQARLAEIADASADRADARKTARRVERVAARQARVSAMRAALLTSLPGVGMAGLWASVIVAPLLLAWNAQMTFAVETLGISPGLSWLFPLAVECGAWVCAFESHRRTHLGRPVGSLPVWMWVLAGVAAAINFVHGITGPHGIGAAVALACVSVLGVLLHHIRQNLDRAVAADPDADLGALQRRGSRWLWHPLLSIRARSIASRTGAGPDQAWEMAHRDRYGVGSGASRRDRRLASVITRRAWKADRKAAKDGRFVIVNGVILAVLNGNQTTDRTEADRPDRDRIHADAEVVRTTELDRTGPPELPEAPEKPATPEPPAEPEPVRPGPAADQARTTRTTRTTKTAQTTGPSDEELLVRIRKMADLHGGKPTGRAVRNSLKVGPDRAKRLLEEYDRRAVTA